ncbi:hypothetical protein C8R46DRAFT_1045271 [Mycena filopes]|nr:hypothetical protein C8R46DRAFT_1045271 [Mycena filopes]
MLPSGYYLRLYQSKKRVFRRLAHAASFHPPAVPRIRATKRSLLVNAVGTWHPALSQATFHIILRHKINVQRVYLQLNTEKFFYVDNGRASRTPPPHPFRACSASTPAPASRSGLGIRATQAFTKAHVVNYCHESAGGVQYFKQKTFKVQAGVVFTKFSVFTEVSFCDL